MTLKIFENFSTNFILLDASQTIEEVYDLINDVKPEYVVVSRLYEKTEIIYYTFLAELILGYWEERKNNVSSNDSIQQFFKFHEYDGIEVKEVLETTLSSEDPRLEKIVQDNHNNKDIIPLSNEGIVVGVYDPQKLKENANYFMRGTDYSKIREQRQEQQRQEQQERAQQRTAREIAEPISGDELSSSNLRGGTDRNTKSDNIEKHATAALPKIIGIDDKGIDFVVQLKESKPAVGISKRIVFPRPDPGETHSELSVSVICEPPEIADIVGDTSKTISVPVDGDSNTAEFRIEPKTKGDFSVTAIFFHKTNPIGTISVNSTIGDATTPYDEYANTDVIESDIKNRGADLMMLIRTKKTKNPFRFQVELKASELGFDLCEFDQVMEIEGDAEKDFRAIYEDIENFEPGKYSKQELEADLESIGRELFDHLFPRELKEFYWKHKNEIKTIQIFSSEPWIPWEIIKPYDDEGNRTSGFLAEDHAVTRWISSVKRKKSPTIKSIRVVLPKDTNLLSAIDEADFIKDFYKEQFQNGTDFKIDSSLKDVQKSLKEGDFDIWHFVTHGEFNEKMPNASAIILEEGKIFQPRHLAGINLQRNPLVILNACQTANQDFFLTGISGWANSFIKNAKAFAFIGTLWSVDDKTAFEFTKALYQRLLENIPLDKAVMLARNAAKNSGDPSWLAYSLYAPPNTVIQIGNR